MRVVLERVHNDQRECLVLPGTWRFVTLLENSSDGKTEIEVSGGDGAQLIARKLYPKTWVGEDWADPQAHEGEGRSFERAFLINDDEPEAGWRGDAILL